MDLLSLPYALFVLTSALLFHACPGRLKWSYLTAVSVLIYGYYSPASAAILVVTALTVFVAARALENRENSSARRRILFLSVCSGLVAYLFLIKLLPILRQRGDAIFTGRILLALGVSYYTFKLLGYVIDVYWGKYPAWTDPMRFLAFATFYPQLPAGPIQRAPEFEISPSGDETAELMIIGLRRILFGIVKKTAIADQLGSMLSYIDGVQPQHSNYLWIAACLYALEMYFDFSALTDIAIGTAALFGIRSPENFAGPFFASSISQFWRRWHMTLTLWLTDYVFTPLRMWTRNLHIWGLIISITVNMVLIGLWHGIGVGFLLYGLVQSAYVIVDSLTSSSRRRFYRNHPVADTLTNATGPILVFAIVTFSLVFFRAESIPNISYQIRHLWDGLRTPVASLQELYYGYGRLRFGLTGLATATLLLWEYLQVSELKLAALIPRFSSLPVAVRWVAYYAALGLVVTLHEHSVHFIYVQY